MNIHRFLMVAALSFSTVLSACAARAPSHVMTHEARFNLDPSRHASLVTALDAEMAQIGLSRYGAAPGINELKGRKVLVADYRFQSSDVWAFLTVHDVNEAGDIRIYVYSTVLSEKNTRHDAIFRLDAMLSKFGATLVERPKTQ